MAKRDLFFLHCNFQIANAIAYKDWFFPTLRNMFGIKTLVTCYHCGTKIGVLGHKCMANIITLSFIKLGQLLLVKGNIPYVIQFLLLPLHFVVLLHKHLGFDFAKFDHIHLSIGTEHGLWPNLTHLVNARTFMKFHNCCCTTSKLEMMGFYNILHQIQYCWQKPCTTTTIGIMIPLMKILVIKANKK